MQDQNSQSQNPEDVVSSDSFDTTADEPTSLPVSEEPVPQEQLPEQSSEEATIPEEDPGQPRTEKAWAPKQNYTEVVKMFEPADPKRFGQAEVIALPSAPEEITDKILGSTDRQSDYNEDWYETLSESQKSQHEQQEFTPALENQNRRWTNAVSAGGVKLTPQRLRPPATGENITGDRAVVLMSNHLGLGVPVRIPFWNSGIWVSLRSPHEPDILALMRSLTDTRVTLGKSTYAMSFSNHMLHTVEEVYNVFQSHITNTTLASNQDLLDVLTVTDIPVMMLALASAIYPNGFDYTRSCISDPAKCQHVTKGRLVLSRTLQVDESKLSQAQIKHMLNMGNRTVTKEQALEYQKQMPTPESVSTILTSSTGARFKVWLQVPTLREYFESGRTWASMIASAANDALGMQAPFEEKNRYMASVSSAVSMRSISHWIKSFEPIYDDVSEQTPVVIEDRDGIEKIAANVISRDRELSLGLLKAVRDFNNDVTVTIVGISNYACEVCKQMQFEVRDEEGKVVDTPVIIPVDVATTFFSLLRQRVLLINDRA